MISNVLPSIHASALCHYTLCFKTCLLKFVLLGQLFMRVCLPKTMRTIKARMSKVDKQRRIQEVWRGNRENGLKSRGMGKCCLPPFPCMRSSRISIPLTVSGGSLHYLSTRDRPLRFFLKILAKKQCRPNSKFQSNHKCHQTYNALQKGVQNSRQFRSRLWHWRCRWRRRRR